MELHRLAALRRCEGRNQDLSSAPPRERAPQPQAGAAYLLPRPAQRPRRSGHGKPLAAAREIGKLLDLIEAGQKRRGTGGADIGPLMERGVPGFGLRTVRTHYFDWHHTPADTFDKVDPHDFRLNVACLAVLTYVLADMPDRLQ